jgi:putative RNA 2'-phosphotransferase
MTREHLDKIVRTGDKQRFALSDDGQLIRANQGHSVGGVDLQLRQKTPPSCLFHGTVGDNGASIERKGLLPMKRNQVHLAPDVATATAVGGRRGTAVIFEVDAHLMHADGVKVWLSVNGVWLAKTVAAKYLSRHLPAK